MKPLDVMGMVSIILPVYNVECYIECCLSSLSAQTYSNLEVIVVDDGSTDRSGEICDAFAMQDTRFKVIHKENAGVSSARNTGLSVALGQYIAFVDADDYVVENYIEILVDNLQKTNVQMVCTDYFTVTDGMVSAHSDESNQMQIMTSLDAINMLHDKTAFCGYLWNKLFLRDVLLKNEIFFEKNVKIWEDMLFCLIYLTKIETVLYLKKPIYYYVQRSDSAMGKPEIWNEQTHLVALEKMWDIVRLQDGSFKKYVQDYYANDLAGLLGKNRFADKNIMSAMLQKIDALKADLTIKHKIKVFLVRIKCCLP